MTIDLKNPLVQHVAQFLIAMTVIFTTLWAIAESKVEGYVENIILAGDYAKSKDVDRINKGVDETKKRVREIEREQDRQGITLKNIEKSSTRQEKLLEQFILQNQSGNRNR